MFLNASDEVDAEGRSQVDEFYIFVLVGVILFLFALVFFGFCFVDLVSFNLTIALLSSQLIFDLLGGLGDVFIGLSTGFCSGLTFQCAIDAEIV